MTPRVYVAASSSELARARWAMEQVEAAGLEVASDWVSVIEAVGVANPTDVPRTQRADWSQLAMEGIGRSRALWLLAPEVGAARGAFFEFGYATARGVPCVVSGPQHAASIFAAVAHEVATDELALAMLRGWLR